MRTILASQSPTTDSEVDGTATDLEGVKLDYQYWGNRAGAIAASQLPLVTALGTKNNVVGRKFEVRSSNAVADASIVLYSHHGNQLRQGRWVSSQE